MSHIPPISAQQHQANQVLPNLQETIWDNQLNAWAVQKKDLNVEWDSVLW